MSVVRIDGQRLIDERDRVGSSAGAEMIVGEGEGLHEEKITDVRRCVLPRAHDKLFDNHMFRQRDRKHDARGDVFGLEHFRAGVGGGHDGTLLQKRRVDVAGKNGTGADTVLAFFSKQRLRQSGQAEFARDICRPSFRVGDQAGVGDDVDDRSMAARPHPGEYGGDAVIRADQVGLDDLAEVVGRKLLERAAGDIGAGAVGQDVDGSKVALNLRDGGDDRVVVRDIAGDGKDFDHASAKMDSLLQVRFTCGQKQRE